MKYLIRTKWWSLFDRTTPDNEKISWKIVESDSVENLIKYFNEQQTHLLDAGESILDIYELGSELKLINKGDFE